MTLLTSIVVILFTIYFILTKNNSGIISLILLSVLGDMFFFNIFGSRLALHHLILFAYFPEILKYKNQKEISSILSKFKYEYFILIILGVLFGFLFPWINTEAGRTWSQVASGRSVVALINILTDILLVYFIYNFFNRNKISVSKFLNIISILIIIISFTACIDLLFNYPIYSFLFGNDAITENINGRLLGFSKEPKSLGRIIIPAWFLLLIYKTSGFKIKYFNASLILGLLTIIFSFSFSTYFIFIISFILFLKSYISKIKIINFIFIFCLLFVGYNYITKDAAQAAIFLYKYQLVTQGSGETIRLAGEPSVFASFEIFDRAALNFLYRNPSYLFFGTGPNLISIPSSEFITASASNIFNGYIVGIPGNGIINLISRSGLLGLSLYLLAFVKIYKYLKSNKNLRILLLIVIISFVFNRSIWFYLLVGFVLSQKYNFNKKNQNVINNYTSP